MSSQLEQIQQDIYGRTSDAAYFTDIQVLLFRPRTEAEAVEIKTKIDEALAGLVTKNGKSGAAVIVLMPTAQVSLPNIPGPRFDIIFKVRVYEMALVNMGANGTGKSAEEIALNVQNLHHHFYIGNYGATLIADTNAIEPVMDDEGRIVYDCNIKCMMGLSKPAQVALPVISGAAAAVTLTCATAGSSILYTTDGSFPWTGNTNAHAYTVPFAVASGSLVRAVANKSGLQGSGLAAAIIT